MRNRGDVMVYTQSEAELEKKLIQTLQGLQYDYVNVPDEDALLENFREQIFLHNKKTLNETPLSDDEFRRLMTVMSNKGVFDSAYNLRQLQDLERDDGSRVYIELINRKDWCKNRFQVTNQITAEGRRVNRYDVTLLINGLPLVQIELKRRGMELKQAFNQINRYKRESFRGLFRYIQIFVISNGVNTKYVANSEQHLNYEQAFYWTDPDNKRINAVHDFARDFLEPCMIAKMITRYMVINQTEKKLMVMRPYQVYGVERLLNLATETRNNGYVWHTTGSGKTLTSFKLAQLLAHLVDVEKVIFLVDRKDLDAQTWSEFNKFEPESVDMTTDTHTLIKHMNDSTKTLIISTIQKMHNAIKKKRYQKTMEKYIEARVIFLIDECHRTQFGDMHKMIKKHFQNAQYFGFTGTPIFQETASQDLATGDLFGKQVHNYLIKDAIRDGNVLGFNVDYLRTFNINPEAEDDMVEGIDTAEILESEKRIEEVVKNVFSIHPKKTRNGEYNAIFAASSIRMANKYYRKFQDLNEEGLVIVPIFSYNPNDEVAENEKLARDKLEEAIREYNGIFQTNYSTDTYSQYFTDVSKRFKNKEIDILVVVNMFLTGFDSKMLNTLYLDKRLQNHNLIQAFSRTNRVHTPRKPFGNIVSFLTKKTDVEEAIYLYSKTDSTDTVLLQPYEEYVRQAQEAVRKLKILAPDVQSVDELESGAELKGFIHSFRELARIINTLENYLDFRFEEEEIHISRQEFEDYKSKYLDLSRDREKREKTSVLDEISFEVELLARDRIDVDYILKLIADLDHENEDRRRRELERIHRILDQSDTEELHSKVELLRRFIESVVPTLEKEDIVEEVFEDFLEKEKEKKIYDLSHEVGVDENIIKEMVYEYQFTQVVPYKRMEENVKGTFLRRHCKTKKLEYEIRDIADNY